MSIANYFVNIETPTHEEFQLMDDLRVRYNGQKNGIYNLIQEDAKKGLTNLRPGFQFRIFFANEIDAQQFAEAIHSSFNYLDGYPKVEQVLKA